MSFASAIETIAKIQCFFNVHDFDVFFAFLKR
jgi:hypothetical protein